MDDFRPMLESRIRAAFRGVVLGTGYSIRQTRAIDERTSDEYRAMDEQALHDLKTKDVVDDWEALDRSDLEKLEFCWVDFEGFRYYLPAMMLSYLEPGEDELNPDYFDRGPSSWMGIQLFSAFKRMNPMFKELSQDQQQVCALYAKYLPQLVEPDSDEAKVLERRLSKQWELFIPLAKDG